MFTAKNKNSKEIPSGTDELVKRSGNPTPALSAAAVGTLPLTVAEIFLNE